MTFRILDAYCNSGGATWGYKQAIPGAHVTGIDIDPQPNYVGDAFVRGDAVAFILEHGAGFDFIHTSPPCQFGTKCQRIQGREHPNLIPATRSALGLAGRPYVIENVEDAAAHLEDPVTLCGAMFGLRTYRHRLFEAGGGFVLGHRLHPRHVHPVAKMGRRVRDGEFMHVVGNFTGAELARQVMGMPWATRDELREAIPPAYTRWIGGELASFLALDQDADGSGLIRNGARQQAVTGVACGDAERAA